MGAVNKIDSNVTGLRIAEESSIGVLPGTPVWVQQEPNDYQEMGARITTLVRNPITDGRQRKKGVTTDLEAFGGYGSDFTQTNFQSLLKGVFFANYRTKAERTDIPSVTVNAGDDTYELASTTGFYVGSLVFGDNFTNAANDGLHRVTAVTLNTSIAVAETLTAEASPPADSSLVVVGFQFGSADATIDVSGALPKLVTSAKDVTQLGLTVGEWVYIGGDSAAYNFANAVNNGWKRVHSIATNAIEFDKSVAAMTTDNGSGKTIRIWIGRKLQNEIGSDIVRKTYQLELSLGAPDDSQPSQIQGLYVTGCIPSRWSINIGTADKITTSISFMGKDAETVDAAVGLKSGTRPTLVDTDAFNTSSDLKRIKIGLVSSADEAVTPFFAYVTDLTIDIDNNLKPLKAAGVLGAFDVSTGTFAVSGSVTAYFTNVAAIEAIRDNADVTMDAIIVKNNAGVVFDIPLMSLGGGNPNIQLDEPVTLPLNVDAATASRISTSMNYTMAVMFYDYLPDVAEA